MAFANIGTNISIGKNAAYLDRSQRRTLATQAEASKRTGKLIKNFETKSMRPIPCWGSDAEHDLTPPTALVKL